jgi:hypothetical protein
MLKAREAFFALVMVCFGVVAVNFNSALANDDCAPAPVAKTGQTVCYAENGQKIDCSGTGQDGDYQMGVPWPDPRFTDNGNGTVTDNLTGLMWTKDIEQIPGEMLFFDALAACNQLVFADHDDWRMPNIKELLSMVAYTTLFLPEGHPFLNEPNGGFWTSTPLHEPQGEVYNKTIGISVNGAQMGKGYRTIDTKYVWPVRGTSLTCNEWPVPNADFSLNDFRITKFKNWNYTITSMLGTIELPPELNLGDGDTVDARITIELFGALDGGDDLIASSEATLSVRDGKYRFVIKK